MKSHLKLAASLLVLSLSIVTAAWGGGTSGPSITGGRWVNDWPLDPPLPEHLWLDMGGGSLIGLHYAKPVGQPNNKLLYTVVGQRGRFCAEEQPGPAYTHFHRFKAPTAEAGHGGPRGAEGYWLSHVAVDALTMPWGEVKPGVDFKFMPTAAPKCGP